MAPQPTVTALRELRGDRVAVELDGAAWRILPTEVVVRSELCVGLTLDRTTLRRVRGELKRAQALAIAARQLAAHDRPARELEEALARRGVAPKTRAEAVAALHRAGALDDERFARARAAALASRGYGDAAIRADLERRGVSPQTRQAGLAGLDPEVERARRVVARRGTGARAARFLAARGFDADAIDAVCGVGFANNP